MDISSLRTCGGLFDNCESPCFIKLPGVQTHTRENLEDYRLDNTCTVSFLLNIECNHNSTPFHRKVGTSYTSISESR